MNRDSSPRDMAAMHTTFLWLSRNVTLPFNSSTQLFKPNFLL